ncbi:MAG: SET domain-containing protein [Anaerolineales bacterium]
MNKSRYEIRNSAIQGLGAFATLRIRKGTRIVEYAGERITPDEADRRYENGHSKDARVLIFQVDKRTIIDAGVGGNEAQYVNHSCDPNCESVIESKRVYIEAIRTIQPDEELTYDYSLTRDDTDDDGTELEYVCHCGAPDCRGTMLEPLPKKRKPRKRKPKQKKRKN